jgi:nicotinamidase-related amidase
MKLALMIIDLQKAYYSGAAKQSMEDATEYINAVLPWFRAKDLPILWIQDGDVDSGVVEGTEGFEFIDALKPLPGEHRITKSYGNSFHKTVCDQILSEAGVDTVLITGYCAEFCVLSTYRGAQDLDLTPVILKNGIASGSAERLRMVEDMSTLVSYGFLKKVMDV